MLPQKSGPKFWDRSHCRVHYCRFGVAGGGVSPGAIIGLLGGAAGVVIGELPLSFVCIRVSECDMKCRLADASPGQFEAVAVQVL